MAGNVFNLKTNNQVERDAYNQVWLEKIERGEEPPT